MRQFLKLTLALSFILHLLWFFSFSRNSKMIDAPKPFVQELELVAAKSFLNPLGKHNSSIRISKKLAAKHQSLQWGPQLFKLAKPSESEPDGILSSTHGGNGNESRSGGYGNGESLQGVLIRSRPLEKLANLLLSSMNYPEALIENDIQGKASLSLELSPQLELIRWDKPTGTNDTISAYALVSVLRILKRSPLKAKLESKPKETLKIQLHFEFKTQTLNGVVSQKIYDIVDPAIYLSFTSYRQPQLVRWMLENLPVVPVPGGVIINVGAVVRIIQDWDKTSPEVRREQLYRLFSERMNHQADGLESLAPRM